mmetsp:Transcript_53268/g.147584  ORF Transcript_53268/g.147584 Transcript_53268/m.147584 type:complete len:206 (-) Transcript_53268:219-836(-)|eukprot:CAMPEP_0179210414 /NCGR_PEP_ID=MMETSP0796-20121207/104944_1 /TAXON_ID=73915 /ORGANISM="Pyrodinium bahamense, Strain pbaha01" /LENGTH=205 /DNA_ID=CAMNT_0020915377 /DNA_START=111 /DNA_END=728 /DNA_ORIENTATION=-
MPKTHMGWAKRTIEKEKAEREAAKREEEQKLQLQQQRMQHLQMQQAMGQALAANRNLRPMAGVARTVSAVMAAGPGAPIGAGGVGAAAGPGSLTAVRPLGAVVPPTRPPMRDMPSGPNLPRTRSDSETRLGTVLEWRGKFGWIQPLEPIEHPLAHKHGGRVYVAKQDILSNSGIMGAGLTPGQTVQFRVYSDASGLGAEQCQVLN